MLQEIARSALLREVSGAIPNWQNSEDYAFQ
jgi:hypothetical protein